MLNIINKGFKSKVEIFFGMIFTFIFFVLLPKYKLFSKLKILLMKNCVKYVMYKVVQLGMYELHCDDLILNLFRKTDSLRQRYFRMFRINFTIYVDIRFTFLFQLIF